MSRKNTSFWVLTAISAGSIYFASSHDYGQFFIAGFVILFFMITSCKRKYTHCNEDFNLDIACGWFWLGWITYGYLFKSITVSIEIAYAITGFIIILVCLSYIRPIHQNDFLMNIMFVFSLVLFLIPNKDNNFMTMPIALFSFKIIFFLFLYIFGDAEIWMLREYDRDYVLSRNIKAVRSLWVLYTPKLLLLGAFLQIFFIVFSVRDELIRKYNPSPPQPSPPSDPEIVIEEIHVPESLNFKEEEPITEIKKHKKRNKKESVEYSFSVNNTGTISSQSETKSQNSKQTLQELFSKHEI